MSIKIPWRRHRRVFTFEELGKTGANGLFEDESSRSEATTENRSPIGDAKSFRVDHAFAREDTAYEHAFSIVNRKN